MHRLTRVTAGATLALLVLATVVTPATAAVPGPRGEQWWFTAWAVQSKVWPITQGQGVTVAVIDKGVQASIPDLAGVVLPGTDTENPGSDGRTDVDDAVPAGHGTAMAALIASQGHATGFVGLAPRSRILPIVARHLDDTAPGIRYATDHGAKVISISQVAPTSCPEDLQDAVAYAVQHDVVVVAGAGNDGDTTNPSETPANCAGVLAVGGLDPNLKAYTKTAQQPYVTVSAPATDVGGVLKDGRFHSSRGGTSAATALTSAAVALVRSKYPDLSARDVIQRIMASLRDAGPSGRDDWTGYGAVRPYQALTADVAENTPNPVFAAYDRWAAEHGKQAAGPRHAEGRKIEDHLNKIGGLALRVGIGIATLSAALLIVYLHARRRASRSTVSGFIPPSGSPPRREHRWFR